MMHSKSSKSPENGRIDLNSTVAILALRAKIKNYDELYSILGPNHQLGKLFERIELVENIKELSPLLTSGRSVNRAADDLRRWADLGIKVIPWGDPLYPEELRFIYNPPPVLFYRGDLDGGKLSFPRCAVVGSRNCDRRGLKTAEGVGRELSRCGVVVVSGLALGIDAAAHRGALQGESEFPTVAVLGSGLNNLYPKANERLGAEILEKGGVLLSHFEPDMPPYPSNFLDRNRLIAGLSAGVVVVQAALRSGALSTARHALEEGREVMAVPGAVDDPRAAGTNRLIQQGAALVRGGGDIIGGLGMERPVEAAVRGQPPLSDAGSRIVEVLKNDGCMQIESLREKIPPQDSLAAELLELEMSGIVERLPGNCVILKS